MKQPQTTTPSFQQALLRWYRRCGRKLPWRMDNNHDPYAVWVSEIMLQQTQVATVIDYYKRFLQAFPTVEALANAPLDKVLKLWQGLGYYRRAQNLHKAAQVIAKDYHSQVPPSIDAIRKLPGIGQYTAGAIASIAFNQDEAVLDGNVKRVYTRLFAIEKDIRSAKVEKELWMLARQALPHGHASAYNQALMDLGATICVPLGPACKACPVQKFCQAMALGKQDKLPMKAAIKKVPHYDVAVGIVFRGKKLLINKRKAESMLGGLWEFPGGKIKTGEAAQDAAVREVKEEMNLDVTIVGPLASVKHAYSHFKVTLHPFICDYQRGRLKLSAGMDAKWIGMDEIEHYAFPAGSLKIIEALKKAHS